MSSAVALDDSSLISESKKETPPAPQVWTPSFNPWLIATAVMLATFMEVLDTSVANVALPHISGNLSASTEEATWVLTSYLIANAIILPATSWLTTVFGRKKFLITCIVIFTAASALCGAATSLGMLIFARILQGAGGGALQPIAQSVLLESFPPIKRGAAMAVYGMGVVVAPIIGPTLGGWITDNYSWRWIFYINLPIGILAAFMANTFVEDPPYLRDKKPGRIDYIGFGLMALGLAMLELTLDTGQQNDWFSSSYVTFYAITAAVALVFFVLYELYTPEPIVDLRIFANRNFAVGAVLVAFMGMVLYGSTALLPLFLQTLLGYPAVQSGLAVSPRGIGAVISMFIIGRLIGKIDGRYLIVFGFLVLAYSTNIFTGITLEITPSNVMLPMIISGFATGFIFVPLTTMAMGTLSNEQISNASGIYNLMRNTGGSIGIAAMTAYLTRSEQTHQSYLSGSLNQYNPVFQQMVQQVQNGLGVGATVEQAYGVVYGMLVKQAAVLSYIDSFRVLALVCLLCAPAVFIFKKVKNAKAPVGAH